jgi:hypothetical protein
MWLAHAPWSDSRPSLMRTLYLAGGFRMAKVAVSLLCSRLTSRGLTSVRVHPEWLSPVRNRTIFLDVSSWKIAMPSAAPATVPTMAKRGRSGSLACVGCCARGPGAGGGGRRDGEKIGRSRVAVNVAMGIAHNGFGRPMVSAGQTLPPGDFVVTGKALV